MDVEGLKNTLNDMKERIQFLEAENKQLKGNTGMKDANENVSPENEDEADILRSMLKLQEEIEASLTAENENLRQQLENVTETLKQWAPIVLRSEVSDRPTDGAASVYFSYMGAQAMQTDLAKLESIMGPTPPISAMPMPGSPPQEPTALDDAALAELRSRYAAAAAPSPGQKAAILAAHGLVDSPHSNWANGAGKTINTTHRPTAHSPSRAGAKHSSPQRTKASPQSKSIHPPPTKRAEQRSRAKVELEAEVKRILSESKAQHTITDRAKALPFKV